MLTLQIKEKEIENLTPEEEFVRGTVGAKCQINFDEFWQSYNKYIVFKRVGYEPINFMVDTLENEIEIPYTILAESGEFKIGVFGTTETETLPTLYSKDIKILYGTDTHGTTPPTYIPSEIDQLRLSKQDKLVSGENIKTVNGESVLGSGNIKIQDEVDQTYSPTSENAQSGIAVAEAVLPKLDKPEIAPQVGDILKVTSVNEDGTFATEWAEVEAGSSNEWELLADITTEQEVSTILATVAKDFSEAIIVFNTNNPLVIGSVGGGANYLRYTYDNRKISFCYLGGSSETTYFTTTVHLAHLGDYLYIISFKNCEKQMNDLWVGFQNGIYCTQKIPYTKTFFVENSAAMAEGTRYPVGTTFKIYGRV